MAVFKFRLLRMKQLNYGALYPNKSEDENYPDPCRKIQSKPNYLAIITAYSPALDHWSLDFKVSKCMDALMPWAQGCARSVKSSGSNMTWVVPSP